MKTLLAALSFVLLTAFNGCAQVGLAPAKTFVEQVAYAEAGAQASIATLASLTCQKYTTAGVCTDAAKPLHPARSEVYLGTISTVRKAIRAAATMAPAGGLCLGQPSTPIACLALATTMLSEVQTVLTNLQGK
jgi:hypothetical protein